MSAAALDPRNTLQTLATEALAQRDQVLARVEGRARSLEQNLDAQLVLVMAERLSLAELELLSEATSLREAGLEAARRGDLERGVELVADARDCCCGAQLSEEAILTAETFQTAAEAYVRYRLGNQSEAEDLLLRAMQTCYALIASFGYEFDLRLVHLARNIARVRAEAGRADEALKLAAQLVRVIEGDSDCWPWPTGAPGRLSDEAAWLGMDQVIAEIALALRPPRGAALAARAQRGGWLEFGPSVRGFDRAYGFVAAYQALALGDDARFLSDAAMFYAGGVGQLHACWRCMDADVERIATLSNTAHENTPGRRKRALGSGTC